MLPKTIQKEIFNLQFKISDMAVEFISDEFQKLNFHINRVIDNDLAVTFYAEGQNCTIEMRIDRLAQKFQLSASKDGYTYMPVVGNWDRIMGCMQQLTRSIMVGKKA
jgi:hypothetical protein